MSAERHALHSESVSDLPPPPDFEPSSQPHKAPDGISKAGLARSARFARIGFWSSVGFFPAFLIGTESGGLFLPVMSVVLVLVGLGFSIAAAVRPGLPQSQYRLAVAGIVISGLIIMLSPILIVFFLWASWVQG